MKNKSTSKKVFQQLYALLDWKQKINFIVIIAIMSISALLSQVTPKAIGYLTDNILIQTTIEFSKIIPLLVIILIANVANEIIKIIRRIMIEDTATKTEKKARSLVLSSLLKAPLAYFKKNMTGNIHGRLNRCLDGTIKLEKLLFMELSPAIFNSVAAIVLMLTTLPTLIALPMLLVVPIGIAIVFRQIATQKGIRISLLEAKAKMDGTVGELLNGIEVIRITDSIAIEQNRCNTQSEFLRKKEMKHHIQMAKYDFLKFINEVSFTVIIIGVSAYLASKHIISVGNVLTAYLCFAQLLKPLEELHRILDELSESFVLAEDFFCLATLQNDFSYISYEGKSKNDDSKKIISIKNLSFCYEKNINIIENLNLEIEEGMFLGIVGESGCGKSSLIKAICKLEKCEGDIFIEGRNIKTLSRKDISRIIALVPQSPFLFSGTIYENICYGLEREVTQEEAEDAIKKACLFDFIKTQSELLNFHIAESGSNLSGGQKQRIAISRIFLRKPKILILDEATSALDNISEGYIQSEFEKLQKENKMTIISIAHRLSTLKNCDKIIVMEKGAIVQKGTYDTLLNQDSIFKDIYNGKKKYANNNL